MSPSQYVKEKAAASGSSFYYAFLFLPKARREAITAFYAFCREVDDVVDEAKDMSVAAQKLNWWRSEVHNAYLGQASHPVMQALMPLAANYHITEQQLVAVITGCEMDLSQTRYLDFANLKQYCHLVAGVVGEVAAQIFGQTQEQTTEYAHTLGLAFQLTNIIRDVGEDARLGRIYLPINELQQFNVKAHQLTDPQLLQNGFDPASEWGQNFKNLMQFQAKRAHQLYDDALALLPLQDRIAQKPGLMMASIYRSLLREIEADGFQVLHQRTKLTPLRKLWLAWKVQALGILS
jgi:phytoene synthase